MCSPKRESQDTDCFHGIRSCNGSTFRSDFTNEHEHHNKVSQQVELFEVFFETQISEAGLCQ